MEYKNAKQANRMQKKREKRERDGERERDRVKGTGRTGERNAENAGVKRLIIS